MKNGVELITEERQRQIKVEGWSKEHDDEHSDKSMRKAAKCYMDTNDQEYHQDGFFSRDNKDKENPSKIPLDWPWDDSWWKPKDEIRNLVRAGALIAAEIDRIQRL